MRKLLCSIVLLFLLLLTNSSYSQIAGNWHLVGPVIFPLDSGGEINGIGRIEQIKFDPLNPLKMYATSAGGGLFVSTDSAATWNSTGTDSAAFGNTGAIAASICIDYTNDNILYLGTGDANYYSENYGIWKSTDAGATWAPSNTGIGNRLALEILMSPHDHNTLIAATDDGIWKSTNAGATWVVKLAGGNFTDMQFKPDSATNTIYAASYNAFFISNDMGDTWTNISLPVPALSLEQGGRIGITRADTNMVFLTYVGNDSALCTPLLKSRNSGQSFFVVKPADSCDLNGYDTANFAQYYQGNYNYCIIVSPLDTNTIYIAAEMVWKSTDGGIHWSTDYWWWAGVHCDMHYFAFNPLNPSILYNANDGGVFKTADSAQTWVPVSNGISATECYHAGCSPIKENAICSGLQDNGSIYYYNAEPWVTFQAGDVGSIWSADYEDSLAFYELSSDTRQYYTGWDYIDVPFTLGNNDLSAFPPTAPNTAFISDSDVYLTTDLSDIPPTWTRISNFNQPIDALASSPDNAGVLYAADENNNFYYTNNALSATPLWNIYSTPNYTYNGACIAPLKSDTNVVYMSCGSNIYRSPDRGASWTDVTYNLPPINIINLYNDLYSTNEAMYLATADAVWYKDNTMSAWLNFSKGLPNTCWITEMMIYNDGTPNSSVRVSFYGRGIWESPLYSNIITAASTVNNNSSAVKIYPNPSNGIFTILLQNTTENAQLEIYNLLGQKIYVTQLHAFTTDVNLNPCTPGIYLYKVLSEKGVFISNGKIIVE